MRPQLQPHRARYALLDPAGVVAGHEHLSVERDGEGYWLSSTLRTVYPSTVEAELQWQLDSGLATRLLYIHSRDGWGEEFELEATVTGNGLLAHRAAPDGPTQVELGWGPNAELDYLSAACAEVIMARSFGGEARERRVDAVEFAVEDLVPAIVARRYLRLEAPFGGGTIASCLTEETGHQALVEVSAGGALVRYAGLLTLEELEEPTK
jgi:hypothetical protein